MKRIGFVLLHYNNVEVTQEAVSYVLGLDRGQVKITIVIVDNASPNGSGEILKRRYNDVPDIHIILSDKNVGFAKGNNLGYSFLINRDEYDYIIVMNTDVFIKDTDFLKKLLLIESDAHIIGPDIITKVGNHQNPFRMVAMDDKSLKNLYNYNRFMTTIYRIPVVSYVAMTILEAKADRLVRKNKLYVEKEMRNVVLHGACLVFTKAWIENEKVAFLPITFMYMEEDILMDYVQRKHYKTLFYPNLKVSHMEDASLNDSFKSRMRKRLFLAENMSVSAHELIKLRMK